MRNRHIPRVCRNCHAPLASGAAACWHCGVRWASEEQPPATLRLVPSEPTDESCEPATATPVAAAATARS
jgi:hypothetical protein